GQVSDNIRTAATHQPLSYAAPQVLAESLHRGGLLTPKKLQVFATTNRLAGKVAAPSLMSGAPTASLGRATRGKHTGALLGGATSLGLSWDTTRGMLALTAKRYGRSMAGIDQSMVSFNRLGQSTAQQILDFHRMPTRAAIDRHARF